MTGKRESRISTANLVPSFCIFTECRTQEFFRVYRSSAILFISLLKTLFQRFVTICVT